MADAFIQIAQRNSENNDWNNLYPQSKFETASGTSTTITLTIPNLADGVSKTFIASADNNEETTIINGKNLYKPNTTVSPTLITGKAYTVWYNQSQDCFFIKASAEGDAVAGDVLAGKKFSNDEDTGLVGTMDLSNLIPDNIKKDVNINGVEGALKEKLTNVDFLFNIPSDYTILQYIPSEGIYCKNNVLGKVYLFSEDGTLVKTITSNIANADLPMDIIKDKIVWSRNGTYGNVFITDKEGVLINQFTTSSTLSLLIFSFTGDKIYMLSYSGGTAPKLIYIYDTSGTLLITSEANFHDGCLLFKAYKNNKLVCVCSTGKYIIDDTDGSYYPISIVYPMSIF